MSQSDASKVRARLNVIKVAAVGVLVVGGGSGLLLNRSSAEARTQAVREGLSQLAAEPVTDVQVEPAVARESGDQRVLFSLRSVQTEVPPDPFQPVAMQRPIPRSPLMTEALRVERAPQVESEWSLSGRPAAPVAAPVAKPVANPVAKPAAPAPAAPPEDLVLAGVVHGDPPVAVVQYQGQSLFLKIGEQVADSWRLVDVKERSAIFQMGARRVEVPIKGGSSE